ncbi:MULTISPECIES: BNR repeat-containing protein [Cellulomonas]|uniref:BNR repeat-containing protein n=1 Tax=Cellulomonas TaxID=1707 RepID=UPI00142F56F4|nr:MULTISPECIES: BNR repeat-containing protein [Cellulomonas]UCN14111.1 BNR repeat-containing protein [Cellulomonas iranensis]
MPAHGDDGARERDAYRLVRADVVGRGVAAVNVQPALLTVGSHQIVAYYGSDRGLRVALRTLPDGDWWTAVLDTTVGWDSHNYVAVGVDRAGHLHVAGNMHVTPLTYFRSSRPWDVTSLRRVPSMVDVAREQRVTYPRFRTAPDGRLHFYFRDGGSGQGDLLAYGYDEDTGRWVAAAPGPLIDGEGKRSAYVDGDGPIPGPDGRFHMVWVWRDTPAAEDNHTVSYATSRDLVEWSRADGSPTGGLTFDSADVIDPVGVRRGLLNNNVRLGFDRGGRVVVVYHLRDEDGRLQVHAASWAGSSWISRRLTNWDVVWDFEGYGSLEFLVRIDTPRPSAVGFTVEVGVGDRRRVLEVGPDLELVSCCDASGEFSPLTPGPADSGGLRAFYVADAASEGALTRRLLEWVAMPVQRDRAIDGPEPAAREIRVLELSRGSVSSEGER